MLCCSDGRLQTENLVASCNKDCSCPVYRYDPVCAADSNVAFLTPCHAGCVTGKEGDAAVVSNISEIFLLLEIVVCR